MRTRDFHVEVLGSVQRIHSKTDTAKLTKKYVYSLLILKNINRPLGLVTTFDFIKAILLAFIQILSPERRTYIRTFKTIIHYQIKRKHFARFIMPVFENLLKPI